MITTSITRIPLCVVLVALAKIDMKLESLLSWLVQAVMWYWRTFGVLALNYHYFHTTEHDVLVLSFDHNINIPSGCGIYGVYYRDIGWPTAGSHVLFVIILLSIYFI